MNTNDALQRLEDLPTTAAIADELVSMGIKAKPRKGSSCAIAVYLDQEVQVDHYRSIGLEFRSSKDEPRSVIVHGDVESDFYKMPRVAKFVQEFDQELYPKLVLGEDN